MTETLTAPTRTGGPGPLLCSVRQVQLEPVAERYEDGIECGELAAAVFRVACANMHVNDRPVCKFHREIVDMRRAGDRHYCRVCAENGDETVPVSWTEIPL